MNRPIGLLVLCLTLCTNEASMSQNINQEQIEAAVRKLWSSSDAERKSGIKQVMQIGTPAVEPLVALLSDLAHNQRPRFPKGKEAEGNKALQEYIEAERQFEDDIAEHDVVEQRRKRLSELAINSRLMTDVVYLLGELKAEPAISILVEIANRHWEVGPAGYDLTTPETKALCRIGEAAVPQLIQNLDERSIRAHGFEPIVYGWRLPDEPDDEEEDEDEDVERNRSEESKIGLVRQRIISVLADIGDVRAVPVLRSLQKEIEEHAGKDSLVYGIEGSVNRSIEDAVNRIQKTGRYSPANTDKQGPILVHKSEIRKQED